MFCFWKNLREKYEGKKIERKGKKKGKKIDLKLINYFYILLQTQFTYLTFLSKD